MGTYEASNFYNNVEKMLLEFISSFLRAPRESNTKENLLSV
jgi:hypothetical protein